MTKPVADSPRRLPPVAAVALVIVGLAHLWIASGAGGEDFRMFFRGTRHLWLGRPAYDPEMMSAGYWRDLLPPHAHLLFLVLVGQSYTTALWIWRAVNLSAAGLAIWIVARPCTTDDRWWLAAVVLNLAPTTVEFYAGQVTGLMALAIATAWRLTRVNRWNDAGVLWGLACAIKPFLLIFGWWFLLRRRFGALAAGTASLVVSYGIGIAFFGVQASRDWVDALRAINWRSSPLNASLAGLAERGWGSTPGYLVAAGVVLVVTLSVTARFAQDDTPLSPSLLVVASVLMSPLGWVYSLLVAAPFLASIALRDRRVPAATWLLAIPAPVLRFGQPAWWLAISLGSAYSWAALGIWLQLTMWAWKARDARS
jgi:hypothetical protein